MSLPLDVTLKATAIVCLALAANRWLPGRSAASRHWLLTTALAAAAVLPLLSTAAPVWLRVDLGGEPVETALAGPLAPESLSGHAAHGALATIAEDSAPPMTGVPLLASVWLAGVSASLGLIVFGWARLVRLASASGPAADVWWAAADDWARSHAFSGSVRVLQSDHPTLLATWGASRPTIILPRRAHEWSAARARIVIAHELAHARRGDWIVQLVAELTRSIYWFNPVFWIASRSIRHESEYACDAAVLNEGVKATEYADELVQIARALKGRDRFSFPAPAMTRSSNLVRRVQAMLNDSLNRAPVTRSTRATMIAAVLALAVGLAGLEVSAQTFSTLAGSLADQTGGALPDARLVLTRTDNGAKYEIRSDQFGRFAFVGLLSGVYELQVDLPGFGRRRTPITISRKTMNVDLVLEVGSLEETINVVHRAGEAGGVPRTARSGAVPAPAPCTPSGVGGQIRQPYKVADARPRYPVHLGDAGREEVVVLDAVIGTDGFVRDARALAPAVDADFLAAAVEAVQQWQFTPTRLNCTAIPVHMKVTVRFRAQ